MLRKPPKCKLARKKKQVSGYVCATVDRRSMQRKKGNVTPEPGRTRECQKYNGARSVLCNASIPRPLLSSFFMSITSSCKTGTDEMINSHYAQVTFNTPNTSRLVSLAFISGRERFLFGFTTTSPQCFGTVPPEVGRLVCEALSATTVSWECPSSVDGEADADLGGWRVAWGWRCGCGWRDQMSMTEL